MNMNMLTLTVVRMLSLERPCAEGMPSHLAAGSGLTQVGNRIHVVADDALELGVFDRTSQDPGKLFRLFERPTLPLDEHERKKIKPDLESSCLLQHEGKSFWLGLGSGSTEQRNKGICVSLSADGEPQSTIEFDLTPLYGELKKAHPELNIEGTAPIVEQGRLRLAQRGNGSLVDNTLIDLDLQQAFANARDGKAWGPELIRQECPLQLPTLAGSNGPVPLTITDLSPLSNGRCLFTAAAEDTSNPYEDGEVLGSCIGVVDLNGGVSQLFQVDKKVKLEGITGQEKDGGVEALVVTDNDDPAHGATVYQTWLSLTA
ncbi:MAG: hypothetical protein J0I12_28090 [Candidatus Eremiobacteraeota bacterium]|nr:hypothetical protein [Candidatus Eremiobacteraeota bacterium]